MISLFASTAYGLEELLKNELQTLGASEAEIVRGGVHFQGEESFLYHSLLWSRLASRIFLPLARFPVNSDQELYEGAATIDWPALFSVNKTLLVNFHGLNQAIRHSQYGALKVKDAIIDSFMQQIGQRPDISKQDPDIRVAVFLDKNQALVALDLSGEALHIRGYRKQTGVAPIKENLAAAIILRSGWQPGTPLIDPMCGSGTLLIEAALMLSQQAPGLARTQWGFLAWKGHNSELWQQQLEQARQTGKEGRRQAKASFYGSDADPQMLGIAKANAQRAGVGELINFTHKDISQLVNPCSPDEIGTLVSNPPYGERLASEPALMALYSTIGRVMKAHFAGWRLSLFSASVDLLNCLQLRAERQFQAKNGPLDCVQKNYLLAIRQHSEVVPEMAEDFANRLRKNVRKLEPWAKKEQLECYRLYDADLPDYNVAIDRYADWVVIQEYAAPKEIDSNKAKGRLLNIITMVVDVLSLAPNQVVLKSRQRQKGKQQYEKLAQKDEYLQVREYHTRLLVNLTDYLDTGLFADHRLARRKLGEMARGKDFLNLFAYTATASVYAGLGGARTTTSVDMSRTYLEWAEQNLRLNDLTGRQHRLIQADCLTWLRDTTEQFDLIFLDPPTFSNSKRMEDDFDIQRDYLALLQDVKRLLRPGGCILFSNNKRGFKLDLQALSQLSLNAVDISKQTCSPDFNRRHIHQSWLIERTEIKN